MAKFNGHRSWNAWNVALWLSGDECTYATVMEVLRTSKTMDRAVDRMMEMLPSTTPDGAKFNRTSVLHALRGLKE